MHDGDRREFALQPALYPVPPVGLGRICATFAKFGSYYAMAFQAQSADVRQIALASAFNYRHDVIGIPQAFAPFGCDAPLRESFEARRASKPLQVLKSRKAIRATRRAHAPIALEHLLAQITGIGSETPFLHAPIGTKR